MTIFKCKMCGGSIDVVNNESVAECEYCGTKQTLPTAQDENLQALFNRANQLRMKSEFDRAETLYEKIIQNKPDEPEAHWGLILCKFGIEYVEDPKTFKRIPTCHRTSFDSITADDDYKEALKYSDSIQRALYENEAREIDRIQKEILALSSKEEPYDVFICYKETDENGQRTPDSAIANDIYHQLTNEGFKVFYAAISLEDKLGSTYEPCIFAALNSSKVMLVIGTKPEYFNAVWVKNEWSRFLKMMKNDKAKLLIPCYKGMDAYDLPDDFTHLQAQDMNKIGFINDIVRGIKKVIVKDKPKIENAKTVVVNTPVNANVQSLLRRVFIFLEDGEFKSADEYCEKVLDIEPENAHAYLGKLMAELQIKQQDNLKDLPKPFNDKSNYQKILRFGDKEIISKVQSYIDYINERNYLEQCEIKYKQALSVYNDKCSDRNELTNAKEIFEGISNYKDSKNLIEQYDEKVREHEDNIKERERLANLERTYQKAYGLYRTSDIEQVEKAKEIFESLSEYKNSNEMTSKCDEKITKIELDEKYQKAKDLLLKAAKQFQRYNDSSEAFEMSYLDEAEEIFVSLGDYESSESMVETCRNRKQEYQAKIKEIEEAKKRRKKITVIRSITSVVIIFVIIVVILVNNTIIPPIKYNNAMAMLENGQYDEAIATFTELDNYKDSQNKLIETQNAKIEFEKSKKYENANKLINEEKYSEAITLFRELNDYKDSKEKYCNLILFLKEKINSISAGGSQTVGLENSEIVIATGNNDNGQCNISNWKDIISVSTGGHHTVGLKKDGTVVATGKNNYGQCNVSDWKNIIAISAGDFHTVGLKKDGTIVATGYNFYGQCNVSDWKDIIAISAGTTHTVGLKKDKTVVAVGSNIAGQRNISDWTDIIAVSAGDFHTVGLKNNGTVVAIGMNNDNQCDVSKWTDIVAISAGGNHTIGLKANGTVVSTGMNNDGQCNISNWTDIINISAGYNHTIGLKADGTVIATGLNRYGQCNVSEWKVKID